MKPAIAALIAAALCACGAPKHDVEVVNLPSGATVNVIGFGPAPSTNKTPTLGLRYESAVDPNDAKALHDEALQTWHFFRLQAAGHDYRAVVLTAMNDGKPHDFHFKKIGAVWREVDASGNPIDAPPVNLHGAMTPFAYMIGTWTCTFAGAKDNFTKKYPAVIVNEPDAGGTAIDQTYSESYGSGAVLGETQIGYDAAAHVWSRRGRQTPNVTEHEEAHGPFSRDMTFEGPREAAGQPTLQLRKIFHVEPSGNASRSITLAKTGSKWTTVASGTCKKQA